MDISDIIHELEELKKKHGDIQVLARNHHGFYDTIDETDVVTITENDDSLCHLWYGNDEKAVAL